jgi:hypothetical protein
MKSIPKINLKFQNFSQEILFFCLLGEDTEEGICNEKFCIQWTEWGPWSGCTATCGKGSKSRYRKCKNLEADKIYNYPVSAKGGLITAAKCDGSGFERESCDGGTCATSDCSKLGIIVFINSFLKGF